MVIKLFFPGKCVSTSTLLRRNCAVEIASNS